ncbi:MAG: hypothetical protein PHC99_08860, partial [Methylococcales bacterium]|nr:hypothetical protein [Methylococcales bacterium]
MNNSYCIDNLWKLHSSYSVQQAAALIAGFEPNKFYFSDDTHLHQKDVFLEIKNNSIAAGVEHKCGCEEAIKVKIAYSALINSIKDKTLNAQLNYLTYSGYEMRLKNTKQNSENVPLDPITQDEFFSNPTIDWSETTVTREDLKQWMLSKNFTSSEFFFDGLASNEPDYMNPQHARYSEELAAAVKAWQAMEDENLLLGKSSPKIAMIDWLTTRYNELGLIYEGKISNEGIK